MNLKTTFQDLASELVNEVFADVAVPITYQRPTGESYDTETGELIKSYRTYTVNAILGAFTRDLINAQDILTTDTRCFIPFQSFTEGDYPRAQVDTFLTSDGTVYDVITCSKDASEAGYTMQLRVSTDGF